MSEPSVPELRKRLDGLTIRDAARLGRRLKSFRGRVSPDKLAQLASQIAAVAHAHGPVVAVDRRPSAFRFFAFAVQEHRLVQFSDVPVDATCRRRDDSRAEPSDQLSHRAHPEVSGGPVGQPCGG